MHASNVLVIGNTRSGPVDFGASQAPSFAEARSFLTRHRPAVLIFGPEGSTPEEFESFCEFAAERAADALWILAAAGIAPSGLLRWCNAGRVHDLIDDWNDPGLEQKTREALEAAGTGNQQRQLARLVEERSRELKRLSADLEERVHRRQKTLRRSLRTLETTRERLHAFHGALLALQRADSLAHMEHALSEVLREGLGVEWARVRFESQSLPGHLLGGHVLHVEIPFQSDNARAEVLFAKAGDRDFTPAERDFLAELADALGLALSRLRKIDLAESIKGQWQATFDSIPHPLCLTNGDFEIMKMNRAFREAGPDASTFHGLIGKNCFRSFFGDDFAVPRPLDSPFSFRAREHEVTGQRLGYTEGDQPVQLVLFRSVAEESRYERRILEASKLAELGTIGGSIAHELNNPLGGMLSFLQLILMDLKKTDTIYSDIKAMEEATLRCRDIVQNLLSFSRKQDLGDMSSLDIWDVVARAAGLIELQSKAKGIELDVRRTSPAPIKASPNALAQAICNLLQNAIDAIDDRMRSEPSCRGRILVELATEGRKRILKISDNGTGIRSEVQSQIFNPHFTTRSPDGREGMGLTTAHTIISEHHGSLEILSRPGSGTTAIVGLPFDSAEPGTVS